MKFNPFQTELKNLQTGNKMFLTCLSDFFHKKNQAEDKRQTLAWLDWMIHHAETIIKIAEAQKRQIEDFTTEAASPTELLTL